MKFDRDKLHAIELMGMAGKMPALIARDLGMSYVELIRESENNKDLKNALNVAEENCKAITKAKLYADAMSCKNPGLARDIFAMIQQGEKSKDNEIIIRVVE